MRGRFMLAGRDVLPIDLLLQGRIVEMAINDRAWLRKFTESPSFSIRLDEPAYRNLPPRHIQVPVADSRLALSLMLRC